MNNYIYIGQIKRDTISFIDIFAISILISLILSPFDSNNIAIGVAIILVFLYFILMQHYLGFTLAQKIFKLKIVSTKTGGKPEINQLLFRELAVLTSFTGIGTVAAMFTHDYYSGFYWDRWCKTKIIPANLNLAEFNKKIEDDYAVLFPTKE